MSQLIIGDIGSTTGSWIILEGGKARQFNTTGYNPSLHDESVVMRMLAQLKTASHTPERIIYYGTGVTGEKKAGEVGNVIAAEFPNAATEVHSDMLGAARATCQHGRGIVAILGTGSNCCYYNGTSIEQTATTLGYPLGDEGSGWQIGAELLRNYYYGSMPAALSEAFKSEVPDTRAELIEYLRRSPYPNRYLASFARFAAEFKGDPWIDNLVGKCFEQFVLNHLVKMERDLPVHFVGSIAVGFREQLEALLSQHGLKSGLFMKDPLGGLIEFHRKKK